MAAAVCAALAAKEATAVTVLDAPQGALPAQAPLAVRLDRLPTAAEGTLALFIGTLDVTALVRTDGATLRVPGEALPPLSGETTLVVWLVQGRQWRELHRSTFAPAAAAPAPAAGSDTRPRALTPSLELTVKAQTDEAVRGTATASPRPTLQDLAGRGGIAIDANAGGASLRGGANFAASSFRQEALQFGTRGTQARKVDLADYRIEAGFGPASLTVGHVNWGSHPLLLNSYASRGLIGSVRFGPRADLALSAVNGTRVVGFENILGLNDAEHRIYGAALGVEAAPTQPGLLRLDATLSDAALRAISNFNRGDIPDAEKSRGGGLRLSSRAFDGRLRIDLAWARATYRPAEDPQLSAGLTLTPLPATARGARQADVGFDLLRGLPLRDGLTLTLTPSVRYEEAQPLYKMLGASLTSDARTLRAGLAMQVGAVQAAWFRSTRRDNLDDIPSLLTTRTEADDLTFALPLPQILGSGERGSLWPSVALQAQRNHQFAANAPDFALSGLQATHRPDQYNTTYGANLAWQLGRHAFSYGVNGARQDNRQTGRENADFQNLAQQASLNLALGERLMLNVGVNRSRQHSVEQRLTLVNEGATLGGQWRALERWTLAPNVGVTRTRDSRGQSDSRALTMQTQLARTLELPSPSGQPIRGQVFVRHALRATSTRDAAAGVASSGRHWSVNLGASVTVF
ncbi:MAG: hypothetical protein NZL99_06595 [Burkholderiaceae bacterium]|nr:hypothetical protein [Burkholderiaceae bacterium]